MYRILLIFLNLGVFFATAQIPEILWQKCYGTSDLDHDFAISNNENGYIIAIEVRTGDELTNYHGLYEILLVSTDTMGELIWEKCYGGTNHDTPRKIEKVNDSVFFILGGTSSTDGDVQSLNHGNADLWVIKINNQGDLLWERCYGSPGTDEPRDMILTPDGGFVMLSRISFAGGDISQYYGLYDNWMCKCDSFGNIEWEKTLGNEGLDNGISMIMNSDNNIMMIGAAQKHGGLVECYPDEVWGDVWIVELDLQGNIVSQHCYGGSDYELGYSLIELDEGYAFTASTYSNDGDVYGLHGPTGGPPDGWNDIWVVKLDENMEIDWQKCLGGYDADNALYLTKTNDSVINIIGTTFSNDGDVSGNHSMPNSYNHDIWVVKLNQAGEIEWQQCYGGWGDENLENPFTILKKSDDNYIIASSTDYGPSYDVECTPTGGNGVDRDAWVFEIKDCTQYAPAIPTTPAGEDTVCNQGSEPYLYTITPAALAWDYNWLLQPATAGTLTADTLEAMLQWADDFTGTATLVVRSINDCGYSEWSAPKYVQVEDCMGIPELREEKVFIYPNPAREFTVFEIQGLSVNGITKIHITNLFGKEIATLPVNDRQTPWDVRNVAAGLYFYALETEGNRYCGKVVVAR